MTKQRAVGLRALAIGAALVAWGSLAPLGAQDLDTRWLPWMGCWEPTTPTADLDLLCVRPAVQASGMELLRVAGDAVVAREVVWADAARHETSREGCSGWETGTFSRDGRRLFLRSEHACEGGVTREGGGVIAMGSPDEWIDVRVAGMAGERMAWVQRYRQASQERAEAAGFGDLLAEQAWSVRSARLVAAAPLDVDDVIEATESVPAEAVEALLAERGDRLDLSAAELVRMADAGVPEDLIDVAVAVSYPDAFQVARGGGDVTATSALDQGSLRRRWAYGGAMACDPYFDAWCAPWSLGYYGYYGYGSRFGYGYPYGYGGWYGWGYGGSGYVPTVVVVDRADTQHGRVVNGRGYTRGRGSSTGPSRTYVPRGGSTASPSPGRTGGSAAGSTGSSSSGGTRTAKPRGGRGGS